jgi:hypothetical protein
VSVTPKGSRSSSDSCSSRNSRLKHTRTWGVQSAGEVGGAAAAGEKRAYVSEAGLRKGGNRQASLRGGGGCQQECKGAGGAPQHAGTGAAAAGAGPVYVNEAGGRMGLLEGAQATVAV